MNTLIPKSSWLSCLYRSAPVLLVILLSILPIGLPGVGIGALPVSAQVDAAREHGQASDDPWVSFLPSDGLGSDSIFALDAGASGYLWVGTAGGLSILGPAGDWLSLTDADGLAGNMVLDIAADPALPSRRWFATDGGATLVDDGGKPLEKAAYTWLAFTKADGLVERYLSCVAIDLTGKLWFGTSFVNSDGDETGYGVSALDHKGTPFDKGDDSWSSYTSSNSGLSSNVVRDITLDSNGTLWFATSNGLNAFDGANWITYSTGDGLPSNDVMSLLWHEGLLWIATRGGIQVRDLRGTATIKNDDLIQSFSQGNSGLVDNDAVKIAPDIGGRIWIGTSQKTNDGEAGSGVSVLDDGGTPFVREDDRWRSFSTSNGLANNAVRTLVGVAPNVMWFGTRQGLTSLDYGASPFESSDDRWETFTTQDRLGGSTVAALAAGDGATMWLGTDQSLSFLNYGYSPHNKIDDIWYTRTEAGTSLLPGSPRALALDRLGRLWIGSTGGLTVLDTRGTPSNPNDDAYIVYDTGTGLASDAVNDIFIDQSGIGWFVTGNYFDGGLHALDLGASLSSRRDDRWMLYTPANSPLPGPFATALVYTSAGFWIATNNGTARLDTRSTPFEKLDDQWAVYTQATSGLAENNIRDLVADSAGNIWFGHAANGVSVLTTAGGWVHFAQGDGLIFNAVQSLIQDRAGMIWIGTDGGGISVLNYAGTVESKSDDTWIQYGGGDPLASGNIRSLLMDRWGQIWVGSFGGGAGLYSDQQLSKLSLPIVWRFRR